eukprot:COSAG02_NODE_29270_length_572_cov_3.217586_1_plen_36_part_01
MLVPHPTASTYYHTSPLCDPSECKQLHVKDAFFSNH